MPIPLHKTKFKERGYNQSEFIAKGINNILKKKERFDIVRRTKYTKSQALLSPEERKTNVKNVFEIDEVYKISDKIILLVDDVLTTGSTINNCALALLEKGAKRVDAATLLVPYTY